MESGLWRQSGLTTQYDEVRFKSFIDWNRKIKEQFFRGVVKDKRQKEGFFCVLKFYTVYLKDLFCIFFRRKREIGRLIPSITRARNVESKVKDFQFEGLFLPLETTCQISKVSFAITYKHTMNYVAYLDKI